LREQGERAGVLAREVFSWPSVARTLVEGYARHAKVSA
jgi:hypothetical protein